MQSRALRVVAILFAGLMTGLLFGDWLGPSFARSEVPLSGFVQFQQIIHYDYLKSPAWRFLGRASCANSLGDISSSSRS